MCAIIGYVGRRAVVPMLMQGLLCVEYRGYDSLGLGFIDRDEKLRVHRACGRIHNLMERASESRFADGFTGIAHTRWATHGAPTECNAHPHVDRTGRIAIVHNGVIDNYMDIKSELVRRGHVFTSQTDSEVFAHLIGIVYEQLERTRSEQPAKFESLLHAAVQRSMEYVKGTYAIGVISTAEPYNLVAARKGSPLHMFVGDDEYALVSDPSIIDKHFFFFFSIEDGSVVTMLAAMLFSD